MYPTKENCLIRLPRVIDFMEKSYKEDNNIKLAIEQIEKLNSIANKELILGELRVSLNNVRKHMTMHEKEKIILDNLLDIYQLEQEQEIPVMKKSRLEMK